MDLTALAKEQETLAGLVKRIDDLIHRGSVVTGMDVAYSDSLAAGCAVVYDNASRNVVDSASVVLEIESEYIPGFFQLREGPVLLELIRDVNPPGIVLVDGNGILHPRWFGLASYLGLKMDIQTIGVAKSLMLGVVGPRSGDYAEIIYDDEVIGGAVWADKSKPVYVSIGHRISLETAVQVVRDSSIDGYPEVLRRAHVMSRELLNKV